MRSLLPSHRIVNMFGAIGYSLLIFTYAIVAGTILLWLIHSGNGEALGLIPETPDQPIDLGSGDPADANILISIFAYAVTIIMALVVVFITITLPYWLGRSGSYIVKRAIRLFKISVTPTSLLLAKVIANGISVVPILLLVAEDIGNILTLIIVSGLIVCTLVLFLLQHYLAKMNHLEAREIW